MAQICDLEIHRSALNDRRSSFSTASRGVTLIYDGGYRVLVRQVA